MATSRNTVSAEKGRNRSANGNCQQPLEQRHEAERAPPTAFASTLEADPLLNDMAAKVAVDPSGDDLPDGRRQGLVCQAFVRNEDRAPPGLPGHYLG